MHIWRVDVEHYSTGKNIYNITQIVRKTIVVQAKGSSLLHLNDALRAFFGDDKFTVQHAEYIGELKN